MSLGSFLKRGGFAVLVVLGMAMTASAVDNSTATAVSASTASVSTDTFHWPPPMKKPFDVGEEFEFVIKYEFISAGRAEMKVLEGPPMYDRPTFHLVTSAQSNSFIDAFYKVRDYNTSISDKATLTSLVFHQNLEEGHYRVIRNTRIDYFNKTFEYERIYKDETVKDVGTNNEPVSDILSSFFYARTLPLKLGEQYKIRVFSDKMIYLLSVTVDPKLDVVRVPAGRFECIRIQPLVLGDAIFKARGGRMTIWLTNDEHRMPVLIRSKVAVGAFDAELVRYKNSPL